MTIKFHLIINNKRIKNLENLRDNFYASDILEVYKDGRLINFLNGRDNLEEVEKIELINIDFSEFELIKAIANILSVNERNIKISSEKENQVYHSECNKDIIELEAKIEQLEKEKNDYKEQLDFLMSKISNLNKEKPKLINPTHVKNINHYPELIKKIKENYTDLEKILDLLDEIEKNHLNDFIVSAEPFFDIFKDYALAIFAVLMNKNLREYFVNSKNTSLKNKIENFVSIRYGMGSFVPPALLFNNKAPEKYLEKYIKNASIQTKVVEKDECLILALTYKDSSLYSLGIKYNIMESKNLILKDFWLNGDGFVYYIKLI